VAFVSTRLGQFTYFAQQFGEPVWRGKNILDFGGNVGNILRDPNATIDPERYWCLDVDKESIAEGRAAFPQSRWLFFDRYSFFFNPHGDPNLPLPNLGQRFDYVVAFSVFTNTTCADMLELVDQLTAVLADGGALAFTFIDPYCFSWGATRGRNNFQWRLDLEKDRGNVSTGEVDSLDKRVGLADWFILVNGNDLYIENEDIRPYAPQDQKTFHAFHTEAYMKKLFPHATILPPVNNEMQHCCLIRKRES
jgi:SAM-dependent methyltransferase